MHLNFTSDGVVRPVLTSAGASDRGAVTINVLGLNRRHLVMARARYATRVLAQLKRYQRIRQRLAISPDDDSIIEIAKEEIEELRRLVAVDAEYTALAQQLLNAFPELSTPPT